MAYLSLAVYTFKRDKTELVFDLNKSVVTTRLSEIDSYIQTVQDKLELLAITSQSTTSSQNLVINQIFENDPDITHAVAINTSTNEVIKTYSQNKFLETYEVDADFFENQIQYPISEILEKGSAIWLIHKDNVPSLIGIAKAVVHETKSGQVKFQSAVVALVQSRRILPEKGQLKLNDIFVTDASGALLAHSRLKSESDMKQFQSKLIEIAKSKQIRTEVLHYKDDEKPMMGAYAKNANGTIHVFSTISEDVAFGALTSFLRRSFLFAGIVATVALIAAILFSRSLTRPLQTLVDGMNKVSHGELETRILVKSNDETSILAKSFNQMIADLQDSRHQLEEINRDLEAKVKDRTQQLEEQHRVIKETQDALIQTTRLASVGEIAARAAHEVLNPLTSMMTRLQIVQKRHQMYKDPEILLFSDILNAWVNDYKKGGFNQLIANWSQKSTLHPQQNLFEEDLENLLSIQKNQELKSAQVLEDSEFLISETQRISKIVQSMRSLSHVRGNKEPHSLQSLINDSLKVMGDHLKEANIQILTNQVSEEDTVLVDKDEFIQCATNLIRNSIQSLKSSQDSDRRILRISSSYNNGQINVDFYDNGSGISKENQKRLFETQFSTKSKEEGTGLGLSISRRFIRAVGGDLFLLSSHPQNGTTFRLTLPAQIKSKGAVA